MCQTAGLATEKNRNVTWQRLADQQYPIGSLNGISKVKTEYMKQRKVFNNTIEENFSGAIIDSIDWKKNFNPG